jgi:DNA-binding HxlR family transcriptional regulator
MTTEGKIIRDLRSGRSHTKALSHALKVTEKACQIVLDRLEREGRVQTHTLDCGIVVYELLRQHSEPC